MKKILLYTISLLLILVNTVNVFNNVDEQNSIETASDFLEKELEKENYFSIQLNIPQVFTSSGSDDLSDFFPNLDFSQTQQSFFFLNTTKACLLDEQNTISNGLARYILNCALIFYA